MANRNNYIFTSESVGEGHPDKICDRMRRWALVEGSSKARNGCDQAFAAL